MLTIVKKKLTDAYLSEKLKCDRIYKTLFINATNKINAISQSFVFENTKHTVVFNLLCAILQVIQSQIYRNI